MAEKTKDNPADDLSGMSFLDHLEALRWHLVRSAIAVAVFTVIAFLAKSIVFDVIVLAPKNPDFVTYRWICSLAQVFELNTFCFEEMPFELLNTKMAGQFSMHLWVSIAAGIILAFPYIIFELWRFVKPGLHENERKNGGWIITSSALLFLSGVIFGYFLITPLSVQFLGTYSVSDQVQNIIDISSFISTVTSISLSAGLLFELPVLVYFFSYIGLLTPDWMRKYRRHALLVVLVISAIITPPDIMSQILVTVPVMLLYEISIWVSSSVNKRREKAKVQA